ncbi:hypothetical protein CDD80_2230 [Ophiocordyceps camponoti-rufipedis]|uniref:L-tryptophan decarboxylase PsiD-like domain-containing protein n=1 Tax=Ophiocordyceps camponoti-rufipedis TaxID=2004952 RepID=A0A2C5Z6I7_9HYPO|nr:hypothetical protein CDD80_2230 [Ophiocordyceps camponoti-rufipedis]
MVLHQPAPLVQNLINTINGREGWRSDFELAIETAREHAEKDMNEENIHDLPDFFRYVNDFLHWIPRVDGERDELLHKLCVFYWVFEQPSARKYQSALNPEDVAGPLSFLSNWLVSFAQELGNFHDQPESITAETLQTFYDNPVYNGEADLWLEPRGGWKSFNQFFARHLKPGSRPVTEPNNPKVVVSPADSVFDEWADIKDGTVTFQGSGSDEVNLKGISWKVSDLLLDSAYKDKFNNGVFMHSFLSSKDYHREHAAVGGKVLEVKNIQGQVYLEVNADPTSRKGDGLVPIRPLPLPGHGRRRSPREIIPPNRAGYQWCQTRGLIVIDAGDVGLVAILPIGMAQVSSVVMTATVGSTLAKGEEISYFQFGGSDIVVVFEKKVEFEKGIVGKHNKVGEKIATFI